MAEPLAFHLPQDASLHSLNSFNSFDFGFFADASLSDAACGLAAKMAFTQTATGDATRLAPSAEYPTREALANPAPSAADVASARVSGRDGETRETRDEQQLALAGAERALAGEVASTSRDAMEVSAYIRDDAFLRDGSAPSVPRDDARNAPRAAFPEAREPRACSFSHARSASTSQVFPPLDFGDMSVDQQADALFSKVRHLTDDIHDAIARLGGAPRARARPRRGFSETAANTSLRLPLARKPDASFSPPPSSRDAQGPLRTLSARTFETLLDETSIKENEVRDRDTSARRPAPGPPRRRTPPPRRFRSSLPRGHTSNRRVPRARAIVRSQPRGAFRSLFPRRHDLFFLLHRSGAKKKKPTPATDLPPLFTPPPRRNGSRFRTSPPSRAT